MNFVCPNCGVEGNINEAKLPDSGLWCTCKKCKHRFFIDKPEPNQQNNSVNAFSCPKCSVLQEKAESCKYCGVIFSRVKSGAIDNDIPPEHIESKKNLNNILNSNLITSIKNKQKYLYIVAAVCLVIILLSFGYPYVNNHVLNGSLDGEVFVVTNGAQVLRLALVDIRVCRKDLYDNFNEKTRVELDEIKKQIDDIRDKYSNAPKTYGTLLDVARETDKLRERQKYISSGEYLFEGLPTIINTKSDAEGKFSLKLKRGASVVITAHGSRFSFGNTEKYFWIVPVSLKGESSKKISLDNSNIYTERHFWAPF